MSDCFCHFCQSPLEHVFADLGTCPPSNAFLRPEQLSAPELFYPLKVFVCSKCFLVQVPEFKSAQEIFTPDYVYLSSYSASWVAHAKKYVQDMVSELKLDNKSFILEIGSNDGYLLQHAVQLGINCLGVDPSVQAAKEAEKKGVKTITSFFTKELALKLSEEGKQADLICGINVFAHVPNINDLLAGIECILAPQGVMTMEIPHLLCLYEQCQFDTIYHEHYFYHSVLCVQNILKKHGLRLFHVEELPTHGGSIRLYACKDDALHKTRESVQKLILKEEAAGMHKLEFYLSFQGRIDKIRFELMRFLMQAREDGKLVAGYGAAAKGNTLLNFFGIRQDLLAFVVDASPYKQGLLLPGSRIPVVSDAMVHQEKPDYMLILPWNLKEELSAQLKFINQWGGKCVTAIPSLVIKDYF